MRHWSFSSDFIAWLLCRVQGRLMLVKRWNSFCLFCTVTFFLYRLPITSMYKESFVCVTICLRMYPIDLVYICVYLCVCVCISGCNSVRDWSRRESDHDHLRENLLVKVTWTVSSLECLYPWNTGPASDSFRQFTPSPCSLIRTSCQDFLFYRLCLCTTVPVSHLVTTMF